MNKLYEKLKDADRYKIFSGIVLFLLAALVLQLARITLIHGDEYRKLADSRRVKDIAITAQRGKIRDRNGVVLAGNRPVFAVQLRKDEVKALSSKDRNGSYLLLSRYLEEDGTNYMKSSPILLDSFVYTDIESYRHKGDPQKAVLEALVGSEKLESFLRAAYTKPYDSHYAFRVLDRILGNENFGDAMIARGGKPVYVDSQKTTEFKERYGLPKESYAMADLLQVVRENPVYIQEVLDHPIGRRLAYERIGAEVPGIGLRDYGNEYYDAYIQNKVRLMEISPDVSWTSSAEDDFVSVLIERDAERFLTAKASVTEEAISFLKQEGADIRAAKEKGDVVPIDDKKNPAYGALSELAKDKKRLRKFLRREGMYAAAQDHLIEAGIATGISVAGDAPAYTQLNNAVDLSKRAGLKDSLSSEEIFHARAEKLGINPQLSPYEIADIVNIYDSIGSQGNYAYIPIHYAYEVKDETVAKIEENLNNRAGIHISVEPIRYYPEVNVASHVLGYIGNIAQEKEIKKYIDELGYNRNDLIGKTGMEQVFEERLKGKDGRRTVTVDSSGNTTGVIREEKPVAGKDVRLSIDVHLQKKAEESLATVLQQIRTGEMYQSPWGNFNYLTSKDKGGPYKNAYSGAVVVADVKTGQVLAMANYPSFDPNLFATGISSTAWESLKPKEEKNLLAPRPLYNIATQSAIQPGSIFKMVTASAALEKGLDPEMAIPDGGYVDVDGQIFGCWLWNQSRQVHGNETLAMALRDSCNYYFYSLGLGKDQRRDKDLGIRVKPEEINDMAERFGLGEKTGVEIQIPAEAGGMRPDPEGKGKIIKSLLKRHLDANMDVYLKGDNTDREREKIRDQILAILDAEEKPDRTAVYERLKAIGVDPDAKGRGQKVGLADLIKYTYVDQAHWNTGDTMNVVIGQGSNAYTLSQVTRYMMALANKGTLYPLSLVEEKNPAQEVQKVGMNPRFYDDLKKGMVMVSKSGLNGKLFNEFPVEIAMKTGSAERAGANPYTGETYDAFGWQVAYAPANDPEIAVGVVLFQGGNGANCGPVMQQVMAEYFGLYKDVKDDMLPIETGLDLE